MSVQQKGHCTISSTPIAALASAPSSACTPNLPQPVIYQVRMPAQAVAPAALYAQSIALSSAASATGGK